MGRYVNEIFLMGEVRDTPEFITNENGEYCKFILEIKNEWTDAVSGKFESKTEYFPVFVVNQTIVPYIRNYIKAGHYVYVKGTLQSRKYYTNSGDERFALQVLVAKTKGQFYYIGGQRKKATSTDEDAEKEAPEPTLNEILEEEKKHSLENDDIPY